MKEKIIAKRYAEAFLNYARETVGLEKAVAELKDLKIIFGTNPDFREFLEDLGVLVSDKYQVIDNVLKDFSEETLQFIKLLIDKGRIKQLSQILDYIRINYSREEAHDALLKTTYPLDLELIKVIKERLENKLNKKLSLHIELDPDLLGGIQITVGNTVIDGSVRRRIDELKERLMTARVS